MMNPDMEKQLKEMAASGQSPQDFISQSLAKLNEQAKKNAPPPGKNPNDVNFDDISDSDEEDSKAPMPVKGAGVPKKPTKNEAESDSDDSETEKIKEIENLTIDEVLETINRAMDAKSAGNDSFKGKNDEDALKLYKKALSSLERLDKFFLKKEKDSEGGIAADSEISVAWQIYLNVRIGSGLNICAVLNRQKKYKEAIKKCISVEETLAIESSAKRPFVLGLKAFKIKCLLRKASAQLSLNELKDAKTTIMSLLDIDKKNKEAIQLYKKLRIKIESQKKKDKASFGNIFGNKKEISSKPVEKDSKKEEKEKKLKEEYETAMKDVEQDKKQAFTIWKKERAARIKKEEEVKKKKLEEEEKERVAKRRKEIEERRRKEWKDADKVDPEEALDADELAALAEVKDKGYRNFWKQKTEDEEELLSHIKPSKIDAAEDISHEKSNASEGSRWNTAQTWEEKDISVPLKSHLKSKLFEFSVKSDASFLVRISKVEWLNGDAQTVFVSNKKGSVYDLQLKVQWEAILLDEVDALMEIDDEKSGNKDGNEGFKVNGSLEFVDITNGDSNYEAVVAVQKLDKIPEQRKQVLNESVRKLETELKKAIPVWIEQFL